MAEQTALDSRGGVYAIRCEQSGRVYIGSSQDVLYRWRKHRERLAAGTHSCRHLQAAWRKYGADAFTFTVLEVVPDPDQLLAREQWWLDNTPDKYNTSPTAGGTRGMTFTEEHRARLRAASTGKTATPETRRKQSLAHKGRATWNKGIPIAEEVRAKLSAAFKGKKRPEITQALQGHRGWNRGMAVSEETRQKLSAAGKGRPKSPEHRRKISLAHQGKKKPWAAEANRKRAKAQQPPSSP